MTAAKTAGDTPLPLHVFQIMLSLARGGSHGYAVIKDVAERTGGEMQLGTSTLYTVIKRLDRTGLVEETEAPAENRDPRRKVYRLTERGRAVVREEAERIQRLGHMLNESGVLDRLGIGEGSERQS